MAAWSSKRRAFEYSCNFSTDEAITAAYAYRPPPPPPEAVIAADDLPRAAEVRTNFYIKTKEGEKRWLGSETVDRLREKLAPRLRDYCLSPRRIEALFDAAGLPASSPAVLDLEICSRGHVVEEEAMRPETLRPLDLTPPLLRRSSRESCWIPCVAGVIDDELMAIMREKLGDLRFILTLVRMYEEEGVRVNDEEGAAVMHECGMCKRRAFVGSVVSGLGCGHLFHYHCLVWHLKDRRACPVCLAPLPPPPTPLPDSVNLT